MFLTFVVVQGHPLAKELAGGRVRRKHGEDELGAVSRRLAQDTRCRVVAARRCTGDAGLVEGEYEVTLRGVMPDQPSRQRAESEGTIRVRVHRGGEALSPLGSRRVSF
ncbi:MAG: hypothetical protein JWM10_2878 [Myxococcaceae bacterium]|nr:hypothetical protein [Myxococcaceae bacterium]